MRLWLLLLALMAPALILGKDTGDTAIRAVLERQVDAWNRGDIPAFISHYSQNCTFVGTHVTEGRAALEQRYRQTYSTPAAMGRLTFTDLKIKKIGARVAIVTGAFHLRRSGEGGGDKTGIFSLVFERQGAAWRIVLDHTS
jgi:uncharacterized protein (TIGR02246 family)